MGYSNGITNNPGAIFENTIKSVADIPSLILRPFSDAQTSSVFQVKNAAGSAVHFGLKPAGEVELPGGVGTSGQVLTSAGAGSPVAWATPAAPDFSPAVILAPNSVNRNLIQPTGDAINGLVILEHSPSQTGALLDVQFTGGFSYLSVNNPAAGSGIVQINTPNNIDTTLLSLTTGNGQSLFNIAALTSFDVSGNYLGEAYFRPDCSLQFYHPTATAGHDQIAGRIAHGMLDNTHATYKGRLFLTARDFNAERTFLTGEADGTAPRIGFLGATAVVRQTNGTAAALAAVADGNVKSFLTAISTALVNLGLLAAPA